MNLARAYLITLMLSGGLWLASSVLALAHKHMGQNDLSNTPSSVSDNDEHKGSEDKKEHKDEQWIDHMQHAITTTVDTTARWVDRFFGDPRWFDDQIVDDSQLAAAVGRLSLGPKWDQADGWGMSGSLRTRFYLPRLDNRFSAVIGRLGFDEFISGDDISHPALIRTPDADNEWLIGFGYDPVIRERRRLSLGAGFRGTLRFDPYLRARYLVQSALTDRSQLRWQSVGFWRNSEGFGISQRLDYEIGMGERWLGRWSGRGTFAQHIDGIRWRTSATLYYLQSNNRAYAGETWSRGETAHAIPVEDYGFRGIYRQRYLRSWFFVEPWVGMHWPRDELDQKRKSAWIAGVQFEIIFGQRIMQRPAD